MSHFMVLVVGENSEKQLEPFCEQDFGEKNMRKYFIFKDMETKYLKEYQNKKTKLWFFDGNKVKITEEQYSLFKKSKEEFSFKTGELFTSFTNGNRCILYTNAKSPRTGKI